MNNYSRYTFKAKRKDNGEWVYGSLIIERSSSICLQEYGIPFIENYYIYAIENNHYTKIEVKKETICQCTGLQDIDGKDIFENDIVEINDKFDGIFETNVVFKNGCFGIDMSVVKQIKNPNGWDKNYDKCESFGMNISKYKTLTKENSDMISGFGYHTDNCKIIKNKFDKEED